MPRRRGPFADYDATDLDLLDEQARPELFRGIHSICVPQDVQIAEHRIVYPVPEGWRSGATKASVYALLGSGQWTWERGETFNAQSLLSRWRRGMSAGGLGGSETSRLLNNFMQLARKRSSEVLEQIVAEFVRTWGPLWLCRTPDHHAHGRGCYWNPGQRIYWAGTTELCSWQPVEEVAAFVAEAQQASAVVRAAAGLRNNTPVAQDILECTGITARVHTIADQRRELIQIVQNRLNIHSDLRMRVIWVQNRTEPQLSLVSKLGFIHAVWIGIALLIRGVRDMPVCTGCGYPYMRDTKAREGQGNYCPECSGRTRAKQREDSSDVTHRASKKLYARRKRALERQARQLDAEGASLDDIIDQLKPDAGRIKLEMCVPKWIGRK
jgi:hypothetical protein